MAKAISPGSVPPRTGAALSASDPRRNQFGIGSRVARQLGAERARAKEFESPFAPLPINYREGTPKTGQFASAKAVLADLRNVRDVLDSRNSTPEQVAAAQSRLDRATATATKLGFTQEELADYYYDPVSKPEDYYTGDNYKGSASIFGRKENAVLTDIPTSTTNFRRPRTVAAGYDEENRIVTVIFRDGTAWNYYGIPSEAWIKFSQSITKGPFLNNAYHNKGRGDGDLLRYEGHGPADITRLTPRAQQEYYRIARAAQVLAKDKTTGSSQQNRRPKQQPNLQKAQNREYYSKQQAKLGKPPKRGS